MTQKPADRGERHERQRGHSFRIIAVDDCESAKVSQHQSQSPLDELLVGSDLIDPSFIAGESE